MEPTAETATDAFKLACEVLTTLQTARVDWVNGGYVGPSPKIENLIATAITAAEARAEARGRTRALEEAAKAVCRGCREGDGTEVVNGRVWHLKGYGLCQAVEIRAIESRTGEGEADSADSGEEEKQSGGNRLSAES